MSRDGGQAWLADFSNAVSASIERDENPVSLADPVTTATPTIPLPVAPERRGGASSTAVPEVDPSASAPGIQDFKAALASGNQQKIINLIPRLFDVNEEDEDGNTALHISILCDNLSVALKLADHGADLNIRNGKGLTPLRLSIDSKKFNNVEFLFELAAKYKQNLDLGDSDPESLQIQKAVNLIDQIIEEVNHKKFALKQQDFKVKDSLQEKLFASILAGRVNYQFTLLASEDADIVYVPFLLDVLDCIKKYLNQYSAVHKKFYDMALGYLKIEKDKFKGDLDKTKEGSPEEGYYYKKIEAVGNLENSIEQEKSVYQHYCDASSDIKPFLLEDLEKAKINKQNATSEYLAFIIFERAEPGEETENAGGAASSAPQEDGDEEDGEYEGDEYEGDAVHNDDDLLDFIGTGAHLAE